jgi:hypothetical protein
MRTSCDIHCEVSQEEASVDGSKENLDRSYEHSPVSISTKSAPQFEERFLLGLVLGFSLVQETRVMMRCGLTNKRSSVVVSYNRLQ